MSTETTELREENPTAKEAKPKKEKLTHKERRQRWKAAKREKRQQKKEYYRYAPAGKRIWNLYLKKPVVTLLVLALLAVAGLLHADAIIQSVVSPLFMKAYMSLKDQPLSEESAAKIYELSPIDEEGTARIAELPGTGEDETWTICVYIVGADLEDYHENDLSYVTAAMTRPDREEATAERSQQMLDRLTRFNGELEENGLELPTFFYYPDKPVAYTQVVKDQVVVATREGMASSDIRELTAEDWTDRITVVMQTGGATRWSNQLINPNRTQRFQYRNGEFTEVADLALQPSSDPDTLADFLRFCKEEYPSDHRVLILWNHGGGPFGYGNDSIFNGALSLKDIRQALSSVYRANAKTRPFDIIGFDACLMSTLEVTDALDGFADYYCLSEETEPGFGWAHDDYLKALAEDPTMSPARLAQTIADTYTDYYMRENINFPLVKNEVTFSVIDARAASKLSEAYTDLCKRLLQDAAEDISVLAEIGRCGTRATHYAGSYYNVYNMVDLGNFMDYLVDSYPEECSRVKEQLQEAVLYHRENGALSDSTGIAVYLPTEINDLNGLLYYLNYIYDISEHDAVTALYYYKQAGCLNEELLEVVKGLTDAEPKTLDVAPFKAFSGQKPEPEDGGFIIPVSEELEKQIVDYQLEFGRYDEDLNTITYYGRDEVLNLDGEGNLSLDFDGSWICLNGQPLAVEVISSNASSVAYRSHVKYNGTNSWLELSYDRDTEAFTVVGVREAGEQGEINFLVNTRNIEEVQGGATIVPLYEQTNYSTNVTNTVSGKRVVFSTHTDVKLEKLPEGYYLGTAVITDQRGDSYYSAVAGVRSDGKTLGAWQLDDRFYGRDY